MREREGNCSLATDIEQEVFLIEFWNFAREQNCALLRLSNVGAKNKESDCLFESRFEILFHW